MSSIGNNRGHSTKRKHNSIIAPHSHAAVCMCVCACVCVFVCVCMCRGL